MISIALSFLEFKIFKVHKNFTKSFKFCDKQFILQKLHHWVSNPSFGKNNQTHFIFYLVSAIYPSLEKRFSPYNLYLIGILGLVIQCFLFGPFPGIENLYTLWWGNYILQFIAGCFTGTSGSLVLVSEYTLLNHVVKLFSFFFFFFFLNNYRL